VFLEEPDPHDAVLQEEKAEAKAEELQKML